MAEFKGFGPKALAFFKALKFHQTRRGSRRTSALYESDVLEPMVALLDDLTAAFAKKKHPAQGRRQAVDLPHPSRRPLRQGQEPVQDPLPAR